MKAVLLAAGQSKRMAPLPDKNFLPMLGRPLIVHQVEQLRRCGFEDVIVVGGRHNLEELGRLAQEMAENGQKVSVVEQEKLEDGMAGAVLSAERNIQNEPFVVVSSNDVIEDSAYQALLASETSALLAKKVTSYFPGGYLKISSGGLLEKIIEKPGAGKEPSDLVNIVAHLHREPQKLFSALKNAASRSISSAQRDDLYEVALDDMIVSGVEIRACVYTGAWQAVKYPWHLIAVWKMLFEREVVLRKARLHSAGALIAPTALVRGDVILEDGVRIFDHAVIQGPAYIGKNVVVANNALVRESHIGEGSVVGFSTEIARSYLAAHVWTHTNYIGDSVIASNVSFGSGAVVANLRLDEATIPVFIAGSVGGAAVSKKIDSGTNKLGAMIAEGVRIGVNTSIMPGVKIGNNSFIASGLCISEDIEDRQFVYGKWTLEKRENRVQMDPSAREKMMERLRKS